MVRKVLKTSFLSGMAVLGKRVASEWIFTDFQPAGLPGEASVLSMKVYDKQPGNARQTTPLTSLNVVAAGGSAVRRNRRRGKDATILLHRLPAAD